MSNANDEKREWALCAYKGDKLARSLHYFEATTLEALELLASQRELISERIYLFEEQTAWCGRGQYGLEPLTQIRLPSGRWVGCSEVLEAMADGQLSVGEDVFIRENYSGYINGRPVARAALSRQQTYQLWQSADKLASLLEDHGMRTEADDGFYYQRREDYADLARSIDGEVIWKERPDNPVIVTLIEAHARLSGLYLDLNRIY